ncbi:serine/threonine protein kinase [Kribbella flavida DSM 17836]|uniref:non-specific serine/threonine protein kinase n=1 Tax=Kribbella flavida (strain DSM 17836 / JCM 10339 / NBRC 14399) TaxID=479435 RepID=D2PP31_KRIFD|nr:serine/threonine-protein kinase [Kribbella flavida]ADB34627.1 serine/threonine protein kinase [Kribbella flavida DSM 17836]
MADPAGNGSLLAKRYRLLGSLGRGGMGIVWQARDEVLGREVAVKEVLLPPELPAEGQAVLRQRTLREARSAARLSHPNVVTVYDVVEEDGRPWIVMELVRSRTLADAIREDGALPWRDVAGIGVQVLAALQAAHAAGVLHRDVKPSNVLLAEDGRVVLTDFGIASLEGDTSLTLSGTLVGSPAFIAPERVQAHGAGPESDLWSLGATLYTAVEGRPPHDRGAALPTLTAAVTEPPDPAPSAGPLWPAIDGLLRKKPAERIDAREASRLLHQALNTRNQPAAPTPPVNPTPDSGQRTRVLPVPPNITRGPDPATPTATPTAPPAAAGAAVGSAAAGASASSAPVDASTAPATDTAAAGPATGAGDAGRDASTPPEIEAASRPADAAAPTPETAAAPAAAESPAAGTAPTPTGGAVPHAAPAGAPPSGPPESDASRSTGDGAVPPAAAAAAAAGAGAGAGMPSAPTEAAAPPDDFGSPSSPANASAGTSARATAAGAEAGVAPASADARPTADSPFAPTDAGATPVRTGGAAPPAPAGARVAGESPFAPAAGAAASPPAVGTSGAAAGSGGGTPAAPTQAAGGKRRLGLVLVACLVVVGAVVGWVFRPTDDPGSNTPEAGGSSSPAPQSTGVSSPAPSATATGTPSASTTSKPATTPPPATTSRPSTTPSTAPTTPPTTVPTTGGVPAGYRRHTDATGFSLAVPAGWTARRNGQQVSFREPGGSRLLLIDQTDQPKADPVADWQQQERARRDGYAGYRRIRIDAVDYFDKAADWEFTYAAGSGRQHVLIRGVVTSPNQAYGIYWSTPDSQWGESQAMLRTFTETFRPAS